MHEIGLLGSCVTREPLKLIEDKLSIRWYEARTSIPSMMSRPVWFPHTFKSEAPAFEQRNLAQDLAKSWLAHIRRSDFDVLLLDFIDERFGVMDYNGGLFTWSTTFKSVNVDEQARAEMRYIAPQSESYLELVGANIDSFVDAISRFERRIICNNVYWTFYNEEGKESEQFPELKYRNINIVLDRIYAALRKLPQICFVDIPREKLVADSKHRWGPAPFHYIQDNDMAIANRILECMR